MRRLIPRRILFGNPRRANPKLSHDGRHIAWLAPVDGVLNVWVRKIGEAEERPITRDTDRGIRSYVWAPNGRQIIYSQDTDGDENHCLFLVDLAGGEPRPLTPRSGVQAHLIAADPRFPDEVLVMLNDRVPQLFDVHRVRLDTGERELLARNELGAIGFVPDRLHRIRAALVPQPDGGSVLHYRETEDAPWQMLLSCGPDDALGFGPVGFSNDGDTLFYISSVGANAAELRAIDLESGESRTLASDPQFDVSQLLIHPRTYEIQAVSFQRDREEWKVLDEAIEPHFQVLRTLEDGDFAVVDRDHADRTWLVVYTVDTGSPRYYSYDTGTRRGTRLFSLRPELDREPLVPMKPIRYRARDGLEIHGYLSLPPEAENGPVPAVLLVHGGPWVRDTWGYDPEAQWLANRGYACLQVNYRGSTGFGKDFTNAGDREWGGKMQDDLTDAVHWLVEQGIADPARVGIYGGSYGGFAVLSGLTKTPDLYACGVDLVGPSNLLTFIETIPPYWEPMRVQLLRRVGNPETEADFLRSRSPLFHVDRIKAPLLIAQGANDPRVKRAESIQIKEALEKSGKTVLYMEFPDEGHGLAKPENRFRFYAEAERFLAEHLGGAFLDEETDAAEAAKVG